MSSSKRIGIADLSNLNFIKLDDKKKVDLVTLSIIELKEILERQNKLLANKKFICSLPDRGKKISDYRQKVLEALKSKELVEQTTSLISKLTIAQNVDFKHPMAAGPSTGLKPEVDPYAKVLSQVLDDKEKSSRFIPNKSKIELKAKSSSAGTLSPISPKVQPMETTECESSVIVRNIESNAKENSVDKKPGTSDMTSTNNPIDNNDKSNANKLLEKYKDSALDYGINSNKMTELSIEESLELSKVQIEREKKAGLMRRIEKTIKFYDEIDENGLEEAESDQESDDKQSEIIIRYM